MPRIAAVCYFDRVYCHYCRIPCDIDLLVYRIYMCIIKPFCESVNHRKTCVLGKIFLPFLRPAVYNIGIIFNALGANYAHTV